MGTLSLLTATTTEPQGPEPHPATCVHTLDHSRELSGLALLQKCLMLDPLLPSKVTHPKSDPLRVIIFVQNVISKIVSRPQLEILIGLPAR